MIRTLARLLVCVYAMLPGTGSPVLAANIETLMMPGPLITGHAKYENECQKCHKPFSKARQNDLCLDCHDKVAADIKKLAGHHGRIKDIGELECKQCHTDHKGRGHDIVQFNRETFDHDMTDLALTGGHRTVRCAACHKSGTRYRDAPTDCYSCHKDNDPHRGKLGKDCKSCHDTTRWAKVAFDHDKTDFPLKGEHKRTACQGCHLNERYKDVATACVACHRLADIHGGRYGEKCGDCHTAADWKKFAFDHDTTDFVLRGRHGKIACSVCHIKTLYKDKLGKTCIDCHKNDDDHKGTYGKKCQSCHREDTWTRIAFDHDKDTDFRLTGKHRKVACRDCHMGDIYDEKTATQCIACHKKNDVHNGQQGKQCGRCHNDEGWGRKIVFDHDLTGMPLIGLHALAPCEECHLTAGFKDTKSDCIACHLADDKHKLRLGPGCGLCHNPNGWALWRFDHNTQTDYKLDGAHKGLDCHACHTTPAVKDVHVTQACGVCHRPDDIHDGRFGQYCERCHVTESFKKIKSLR